MNLFYVGTTKINIKSVSEKNSKNRTFFDKIAKKITKRKQKI